MDKNTAANTVSNAGMGTYDVAHSIYLATVEGVSGANQNDGFGFALSAVAELWNIRGNIGNPYGRTKITGRYKGMGVTEKMIQNVVAQYPNGFSGNEPLFDDLLGIGFGGRKTPSVSQTSYINSDDNRMQEEFDKQDQQLFIGFAIGFILCKFVLHFGWILSIVGGFFVAGLFMWIGSKK